MTTAIAQLSTHDFNKTLGKLATYAWIGTGILFVCYSYFVGSITFSIIKQQGIEQNIKGLISSMSKQELAYLNTQKNLTEGYAASLGLVPASTIAFATPKRAFAWNVGY